MIRHHEEKALIEIYDIHTGKLKYSAYTFWQLSQMVAEDYACHTADESNDIVSWIDQKARILRRSEKKEEVVERLGQLLEFGEGEGHRAFASRVSLLLGEMFFTEGQPESAIKYFQKAVDLLPYHVEALHQLARGFNALGQYERAAEALRKANGIFPSEEACLALAEVLEKLDQPKDQEKWLRSLVKNYPRSIKGLHTLAQFHRRRGRTKSAARLIQRIVDLHAERGDPSKPFFNGFREALIWSKYNCEARKLNKILEFLDQEQQRNPAASLGLLKAVMLYKLDKRLCREECCYELGKYFQRIGCEEAVLSEDLRTFADVFGEEFLRGVARFIRNQLGKRILRRDGERSSLSQGGQAWGSSVGPGHGSDSEEGWDFRREAPVWDARLPRDGKGLNRTL